MPKVGVFSLSLSLSPFISIRISSRSRQLCRLSRLHKARNDANALWNFRLSPFSFFFVLSLSLSLLSPYHFVSIFFHFFRFLLTVSRFCLSSQTVVKISFYIEASLLPSLSPSLFLLLLFSLVVYCCSSLKFWRCLSTFLSNSTTESSFWNPVFFLSRTKWTHF